MWRLRQTATRSQEKDERLRVLSCLFYLRPATRRASRAALGARPASSSLRPVVRSAGSLLRLGPRGTFQERARERGALHRRTDRARGGGPLTSSASTFGSLLVRGTRPCPAWNLVACRSTAVRPPLPCCRNDGAPPGLRRCSRRLIHVRRGAGYAARCGRPNTDLDLPLRSAVQLEAFALQLSPLGQHVGSRKSNPSR